MIGSTGAARRPVRGGQGGAHQHDAGAGQCCRIREPDAKGKRPQRVIRAGNNDRAEKGSDWFNKPPYAALCKSSIWRIQLVSGFHLRK